MAGLAVDVGHGTRVTFVTSGWTADLVALRLVGMARRALDAAHMQVTAPASNELANRPYARGKLVNAGQLVMDLHFNPQTNPPIALPAEPIHIAWPIPPGLSFGQRWETTGFAVGLDITDSMDEVMAATLTVQLNSTIAQAEGATSYWEGTWEFAIGGSFTEYYLGAWDV